MARIILDSEEVFGPVLADGDELIGNTGSETVVFADGSQNSVLDGNIEQIELTGATTANTVFQVNAQGQLELVVGGTVVGAFTTGLNSDVEVQMSNGAVILAQTGGGTWRIANPDDPTETADISSGNPATAGDLTGGDDTPAVTSVTPDLTAVNETDNNVVVFTVQTVNTADGGTVDLLFSGIDGDDVEGTLPTTATVDAAGMAEVTLTLAADAASEGDEVFTLSASIAGGAAVASAEVTIEDTSVTPDITPIDVDGRGNFVTGVVDNAGDLDAGAFNLEDDATVRNYVSVTNYGEDDIITYSNVTEADFSAQAIFSTLAGGTVQIVYTDPVGLDASVIELVGVAGTEAISTYQQFQDLAVGDIQFA